MAIWANSATKNKLHQKVELNVHVEEVCVLVWIILIIILMRPTENKNVCGLMYKYMYNLRKRDTNFVYVKLLYVGTTDHLWWYVTKGPSMAWCCRQAASHCLSKCWPRSMSLYGITLRRHENNNLESLLHKHLTCFTCVVKYYNEFCSRPLRVYGLGGMGCLDRWNDGFICMSHINPSLTENSVVLLSVDPAQVVKSKSWYLKIFSQEYLHLLHMRARLWVRRFNCALWNTNIAFTW